MNDWNDREARYSDNTGRIYRGWAARYSNDIERDFRRGFSVQGPALRPEPSAEEMRQALVDHYWWSTKEAAAARIVYVDELGGYLPINEGLSAFFANESEPPLAEEDDLIRAGVIWVARDHAKRFAGLPLYIFRAEFVGVDPADEAASADIVRPLGPPERVEEF